MWVFFQAVHRGGLSKAAAQHSARDAAVRPGRLRPAVEGGIIIQGDQAAWTKPPVDIEMKVVFQ